MSDNSSIEWTEATWNPLLGCARVSPGCDSCYAINTATIRAGNPHPRVAAAFEGLTERREGRLDWTGRINLLPDRLTQPLSWRKPKRIFVNSQSDLFHADVPDDYIARVFAVMALAPQHTFQLLTKRHARMRSLLSNPEFRAVVALEGLQFDDAPLGGPWPLPNVWLGVSVENQQWADIRIPALLDTPAAVRWISAEPLLGPVDLTLYRDGWHPKGHVDWVVVGGESGPGARPMHPDWARGLRDACAAASVPFFFKQWGNWTPMAPLDKQGRFDWSGAHTLANDGTLYEPNDLCYPDGPRYGEAIRAGHGRASLTSMYRLSKKAAGRELDGRTWDEYPQVREVSR